MKLCAHENFRADVTVNRLKDSGAFICDIRVRCTDCNEEFTFPDLPKGLNSQGARVSFDHKELRVPVKPPDQENFPSFRGVAGFDIRRVQ